MLQQQLADPADISPSHPTRRRSVAALGAAALAVLTKPVTVDARRKRRKKKRKRSCKKTIRKEINQTCGAQVGECEGGFAAVDAPELIPCCALLATCDFPAFFACAA